MTTGLGVGPFDGAALAFLRAGLPALAGAGRLATRSLRRLADFTMNERSSSARCCGRLGRDGYSSRGSQLVKPQDCRDDNRNGIRNREVAPCLLCVMLFARLH